MKNSAGVRTMFCAALVATILWMVVPSAFGGTTFDAKVIGVADGDTLTVLFEDGQKKASRRVRLSGIDAPEKAQAYGAVAREQLSRLAFGKMGHLDCRATDQYGRSVCMVRVDGVDVGLRMIELGLAWHYKRYASSQPTTEAASYSKAEDAAKAARTGLWRDFGTALAPVPPWDWRRASTAAH